MTARRLLLVRYLLKEVTCYVPGLEITDLDEKSLHKYNNNSENDINNGNEITMWCKVDEKKMFFSAG